MTNTPFPDRHRKRLRPPRFDRMRDLAAFHLGFSPYRLWHDFTAQRLDEPDASCRRWLEDLPVLLKKYFDAYATERYAATLKESLDLFVTRSVEHTASDGSWEEYVEDASEIPPPSVVESSDDEEADFEDDDSDPVGRGLSEREYHLYFDSMYDTDKPTHRLIRLAVAIAEELPIHLRNWYSFGQTVGRCLGYLTCEYEDLAVDLRQEILVAARGTDFYDDEWIPDLSENAYDQPDTIPCVPRGSGYFSWVYDCILWMVAEIEDYLSDEPVSMLDLSQHFLWFLGAYIPLSETQCKVLAVIAGSKDNVVGRGTILRDALDEVSVVGDSADDSRKPDQYVQQIINKIADALQVAESPYLKDDEKATRAWLREQLLPSAHGIGWTCGPLLQKMVVK